LETAVATLRGSCPLRQGWSSIFRDKGRARPVVGLCAIEICLHDTLASNLSAFDRILNIGNRGFFEMKRTLLRQYPARRERRQNAGSDE